MADVQEFAVHMRVDAIVQIHAVRARSAKAAGHIAAGRVMVLYPKARRVEIMSIRCEDNPPVLDILQVPSPEEVAL